MSVLVQFEGVAKSYGSETVLEGISFCIDSMHHLALLGPSGCGKSTLFALLAGLITPSAGRIVVSGDTVSEAGRILIPPHARRLSMVFQDLALWPNLSALENVAMGIPRDAELSRRKRVDRAREMLAICGIDTLGRRKPSDLSAGQQQRVAIARALAVRPRLLLLDEPFTGLDVILKQQILSEIRSLAMQFEITLVLVSHDAWEVGSLCDRVLVIEDHEVAEQGVLGAQIEAPVSKTLQAMGPHLRLARD